MVLLSRRRRNLCTHKNLFRQVSLRHACISECSSEKLATLVSGRKRLGAKLRRRGTFKVVVLATLITHANKCPWGR
jgi:hypothetical protein